MASLWLAVRCSLLGPRVGHTSRACDARTQLHTLYTTAAPREMSNTAIAQPEGGMYGLSTAEFGICCAFWLCTIVGMYVIDFSFGARLPQSPSVRVHERARAAEPWAAVAGRARGGSRGAPRKC